MSNAQPSRDLIPADSQTTPAPVLPVGPIPPDFVIRLDSDDASNHSDSSVPQESLLQVGAIPSDVPIRIVPDDPVLPQPAPRRSRRRLRVAVVIAGTVSLVILVAIYITYRGVLAYRASVATHWLLGYLYLVGIVGASVSVAILVLGTVRRYLKLREITTLQVLIERTTLGTLSSPESGARIKKYLDGHVRSDPEAQAAIDDLRQHDDGHAIDTSSDIQELVSVLAVLDRRAEKIIDAKAAQVAWGTAVASYLIDPVIVLLQAVTMVDKIATIYAGRPGLLGTLSLMRRGIVVVAFSEVAQQVTELAAGITMGKLASKMGGRVAEGLANGLLMIRFGDAVKAQCRPIKPPVANFTNQVRRLRALLPSLSALFFPIAGTKHSETTGPLSVNAGSTAE